MFLHVRRHRHVGRKARVASKHFKRLNRVRHKFRHHPVKTGVGGRRLPVRGVVAQPKSPPRQKSRKRVASSAHRRAR